MMCATVSRLTKAQSLGSCDPKAPPSFWQLGFKIAHFKCFQFNVSKFPGGCSLPAQFRWKLSYTVEKSLVYHKQPAERTVN